MIISEDWTPEMQWREFGGNYTACVPWWDQEALGALAAKRAAFKWEVFKKKKAAERVAQSLASMDARIKAARKAAQTVLARNERIREARTRAKALTAVGPPFMKFRSREYACTPDGRLYWSYVYVAADGSGLFRTPFPS